MSGSFFQRNERASERAREGGTNGGREGGSEPSRLKWRARAREGKKKYGGGGGGGGGAGGGGWSVGRSVGRLGWLDRRVAREAEKERRGRKGNNERWWRLRHPTSSFFPFSLHSLFLLISAKPLSRECLTPFEPEEMQSDGASMGRGRKRRRRKMLVVARNRNKPFPSFILSLTPPAYHHLSCRCLGGGEKMNVGSGRLQPPHTAPTHVLFKHLLFRCLGARTQFIPSECPPPSSPESPLLHSPLPRSLSE